MKMTKLSYIKGIVLISTDPNCTLMNLEINKK